MALDGNLITLCVDLKFVQFCLTLNQCIVRMGFLIKFPSFLTNLTWLLMSLMKLHQFIDYPKASYDRSSWIKILFLTCIDELFVSLLINFVVFGIVWLFTLPYWVLGSCHLGLIQSHFAENMRDLLRECRGRARPGHIYSWMLPFIPLQMHWQQCYAWKSCLPFMSRSLEHSPICHVRFES